MKTIGEIKREYQTGALNTRQAIVAVAQLFPCLQRLYPEDFDPDQWLATDLDKAALKLSTGEAQCAKFVLRIWNWHIGTNPRAKASDRWKCGMFDICEAAEKWGEEEKAILMEWFANPFWL